MIMVAKAHPLQRKVRSEAGNARALSSDRSALDHATRLVHRVCCLAGSVDFMDQIRTDNSALRSAIKGRDTAALFDWLTAMLSYQGVSDRVAYHYMDQHGQVTEKNPGIQSHCFQDRDCAGPCWSSRHN